MRGRVVGRLRAVRVKGEVVGESVGNMLPIGRPAMHGRHARTPLAARPGHKLERPIGKPLRVFARSLKADATHVYTCDRVARRRTHGRYADDAPRPQIEV